MSVDTTAEGGGPAGGQFQSASSPLRRKPLISPTSSFVDFMELETEIYTEEDIANAHQYEPYQFRQIKKPTTDFETCVHMLKGSVGAGVLAMPKAFYHAGVAIGVPGTIFMGMLGAYGIHVMLKMQYEQCKRLRVPFLTLPRSLKIAFKNGPRPFHKIAWLAPFLVDFFLVCNQIGLCATYVTFIARSTKTVMEPSVIENMDIRLYMLGLFIPVLVINYIRNLKRLAPVSLIADVLTVIAFACCFYYIFRDREFKTDKVNMVSTVATWPLFIGTVIFALEAVGVMIALEHNMKNPQHFLGKKGIFTWSMVFVVLLYMFVGLFAYLKYGDETKETLIASLPRHEWLSGGIQVLIALAIYGSYPLQCFVGLEIIWGNYLIHYIKDHNKEYCIEYILRTCIVILTFVLAAVMKQVDLAISLVGTFCLSILGLVVPFLLELCTLWPTISCLNLIKDICFVSFGLCILVIGTYISLLSIIAENEK